MILVYLREMIIDRGIRKNGLVEDNVVTVNNPFFLNQPYSIVVFALLMSEMNTFLSHITELPRPLVLSNVNIS